MAQARSGWLPRYAAAGLGRTGRDRQSFRQALPRRVRGPCQAARLAGRAGASARAAGRAETAFVTAFRNARRGDGGRIEFRRRHVSRRGRSCNPVRSRRGHHAGRAVAAFVASVCRVFAVLVSGSALDQPVTVHVLFRFRRLPGGQCLTRNPCAPGTWYGYRAPDRRNAPPRGDARRDVALERELLADPKERAEHVMLADLGRNDVGRVAATGTVRLTETMTVERYSHVMHIVSNVEGRLREGLDCIDVFRAAFPAGTVSGAPKVRAMEIIDELEPDRRGVYAGAAGYLGFNGDMDLAIAIRTAVVKGGQMHVQAGAGIVADSVPENEWQETRAKARAVLRAAEIATRGMDGREGS